MSRTGAAHGSMKVEDMECSYRRWVRWGKGENRVVR
jgi:hypothetical protein